MAIAHVRGGGEMGRHWYDDGKMLHKRNTFSDFAACARHLVRTGWTTHDRIVGEGGSAGGLLIGAVANEYPDLFGGLVADVPFVDALTSMLDASLPLTVTEYDEWGNPADDPRPTTTSPATRRTTTWRPRLPADPGHDVAARHPRALRRAREVGGPAARHVPGGSGRPDVLLKTELAAGHGGVSGRYQGWRDRAFTLAWVLDRMGLAD